MFPYGDAFCSLDFQDDLHVFGTCRKIFFNHVTSSERKDSLFHWNHPFLSEIAIKAIFIFILVFFYGSIKETIFSSCLSHTASNGSKFGNF